MTIELAVDSPSNPGLVLGAAIRGDEAAEGQARDRLGRDPHRRVRRLGGAAHRRVDRQAREGHPARRARPALPRAHRESAGPPDRAASLATTTRPARLRDGEIEMTGSLGSMLLTWEYAVAVAGRLLGINPFDQPDVEAAKVAARGCCSTIALSRPRPRSRRMGVEVRGTATSSTVRRICSSSDRARWPRSARTGTSRCRPTSIAWTTPRWPKCATRLAARVKRPSDLSAGVRAFLHSTGQFHKGGPAVGVFLQLIAVEPDDLAIPDRPFTLRRAASRRRPRAMPPSSAQHGRPVLSLTIHDPAQHAASGARRPAVGERWPQLRSPRTRIRSACRPTAGSTASPGPSGLIIFGVTGDLAARSSCRAGLRPGRTAVLLPPGFALVGFARRDWGTRTSRRSCHDSVRQYARTPFDEDVWNQLEPRHPVRAGRRSTTTARSSRLKATIEELDRGSRHDGQPRVLPVDSAGFVPRGHGAAAPLRSRRAARTASGAAWSSRSRSGTTSASARQLNDVVESVFPPDSVFRIDHYLGKETVQNILALRFANMLYEPIWNANYVDHIQITMAEDIGVGWPRRILRRHRGGSATSSRTTCCSCSP